MSPLFKIWRVDDEKDDAWTIAEGHSRDTAADAESAACAYVNQHWGDFSYAKEVEVLVCDSRDVLTRWKVSVEMVPHVTARQTLLNGAACR